MEYDQLTLSAKDLKPANYNPRQISATDYDALKDSISKFGMAEPIVVNSNPDREGIVIGGHQRLRACMDLGIKEVPCFLVNLEEKDERELNIRLNRNHGEFDFDALANHFDAGDLLDWGMSARELELDVVLPEDGEEEEKPKKEKKFEYKKSHSENGFVEPVYAFVPSIGISEIIVTPENFDTKWQNTLMVTSLNGRTIYLTKFQNKDYKNIVYVEKIYIGERIRDIKYIDEIKSFVLSLERTADIGVIKKFN